VYEDGKGKYCSRSCSASHNMILRYSKMSEEEKLELGRKSGQSRKEKFESLPDNIRKEKSEEISKSVKLTHSRRSQEEINSISIKRIESSRNIPFIKSKIGSKQHKITFVNMFNRAQRDFIVCDYSYTFEDYERFVADIGPIPTGMIKPSIGRINHNLSYIVGNFKWQEMSDNIAESNSRRSSSST
jgi:hypothetical protein